MVLAAPLRSPGNSNNSQTGLGSVSGRPRVRGRPDCSRRTLREPPSRRPSGSAAARTPIGKSSTGSRTPPTNGNLGASHSVGAHPRIVGHCNSRFCSAWRRPPTSHCALYRPIPGGLTQPIRLQSNPSWPRNRDDCSSPTQTCPHFD